MGNQQPFRACCCQDDDQQPPSPPQPPPPSLSKQTVRSSSAASPPGRQRRSRTASTSSTVIPAAESSLHSPLLASCSPEPVATSITPPPPSADDGDDKDGYGDDDMGTDDEDEDDGRESVYRVPAELPANSSGLSRLLHASQYNTNGGGAKECKEEDYATAAATASGLRRVERRTSLLGEEDIGSSPKFAPFPVDKLCSAKKTEQQLLFGILASRGSTSNLPWLVSELLKIGSPASFVRGETVDEVVQFESDVARLHPDVVVLGDLYFATSAATTESTTEGEDTMEEEVFPAAELAKNLRLSGYTGCVILIAPSQAADAVDNGEDDEWPVDFSVVDGLLEESVAATATIKSSVAIAMAIAQRRGAPSSSPSLAPSLQGSWNSTFGFGSMSGAGGCSSSGSSGNHGVDTIAAFRALAHASRRVDDDDDDDEEE